GIQMGASTHSQLHEMTPVSFRTMKAMVSSPQKPIPPAVLPLFLFSFMVFFLLFVAGVDESDAGGAAQAAVGTDGPKAGLGRKRLSVDLSFPALGPADGAGGGLPVVALRIRD